jgi:hypothetical protein
MNCEGIARIVDSGRFGALNAVDRRDAEAHAQQCRQCAPLWIMHARLAASPVPDMPPELSKRCLALITAAGQVPASHRAPRLVIVVTSLVALAAAASMLGVSLSSKLTPHHDAALTSFTVPGASGNPSAAAGQAFPAAMQAQAASSIQRGIPLFPPQYAADQMFAARSQMALEKLVQLHPEVMRPAPPGLLYDGRILLRFDGEVLDHAMRAVAPVALQWTRSNPKEGMPTDGGELLGRYVPQGTQLADGRTLGADLNFRQLFVPNTYDLARSSLRVEEIVRTQRAALMAPTTETGGSHLTLLLSGAGAIQREVAGHIDKQAIRQQEQWSASQRAEAMAGVLGVSKNEIGLMGSVTVSDIDTKRGVVVDYAWQRLPGESAPEYRQGGDSNPLDAGVDFSTAVALVERVMPEAFTAKEVDPALGRLAILLSEKGEFIRTARFGGSNPERAFPGISFVAVRSLTLDNGKGSKAGVYFMWQRTPPGTEPSSSPAATTR